MEISSASSRSWVGSLVGQCTEHWGKNNFGSCVLYQMALSQMNTMCWSSPGFADLKWTPNSRLYSVGLVGNHFFNHQPNGQRLEGKWNLEHPPTLLFNISFLFVQGGNVLLLSGTIARGLRNDILPKCAGIGELEIFYTCMQQRHTDVCTVPLQISEPVWHTALDNQISHEKEPRDFLSVGS